MALSTKRYSFIQADLSLSGGVIDFMAPGKSLGKSGIDSKRKCNEALANDNDSAQVKECRGDMSDECSRGMDGACKGSGLYKRLVNKPLPEAALPNDCDTTNPNYSIDICFVWLERFIVKSTMSFDFKGFIDVPRSIDRSFRGSAAGLRLLQSSTDVKVDLVTKNDPAAVLPSSLSKMDSSAINVDSSTSVSVPNTETYLNEFNQESDEIELSQSYLTYTIYSLMIFFGLLL